MDSEKTKEPVRSVAKTTLYVKAAAGLKLRDRKVSRLVRKMRDTMPWLEAEDLPAARAWAELEYLSGQVYAILRLGTVVSANGEGKRLLDDYRKLRQAQLAFARELGMTPAARMAIRANGTRAALDLAAQLAETGDDAVEEGVVDAEN